MSCLCRLVPYSLRFSVCHVAIASHILRGALFALFGLFLVGVGFVMRLRRHFGPAVPQVLWFQTRLTLRFSFGFLSPIVCFLRSCEGVGIWCCFKGFMLALLRMGLLLAFSHSCFLADIFYIGYGASVLAWGAANAYIPLWSVLVGAIACFALFGKLHRLQLSVVEVRMLATVFTLGTCAFARTFFHCTCN